MREVAIRVPASAVEEVLDALLMIVPGGVRECPDGDAVELVMRGEDLPARSGLARAAFGAGTHPTTRTCLELMLTMAPSGSFADLGCGSGVLAILAARLGWAPVTAIDAQPASAEATRRNAAINDVEVHVGVADLSREIPPPAAGFAANVPPAVHCGIAAGWRHVTEPRIGLVSGFGPARAQMVIEAYAAGGLRERRRHEDHGWVVAELFA